MFRHIWLVIVIIDKKSLRLKEESGVITEEERQQIEDMKLFKKENLQKIVSFKIGKE